MIRVAPGNDHPPSILQQHQGEHRGGGSVVVCCSYCELQFASHPPLQAKTVLALGIELGERIVVCLALAMVDKDDVDTKTETENKHGSCSGDHNRRRRLSRKEQKARKKKKQRRCDGGTNDATTKSVKTHTASIEPATRTAAWTSRVVQTTTTKYGGASAQEYASTYRPTPFPDPSTITVAAAPTKSLGKWFPKAVKVKPPSHIARAIARTTQSCSYKQTSNSQSTTNPSPTCSLLLFYQYVTPVWSDARVEHIRQCLVALGRHRPTLAGRIRLAPEGLNCTLTAVDLPVVYNDTTTSTTTTTNNNNHNDKNKDSTPTPSAAATLRHVALDLARLDPVFLSNIDFKYTDGLTADRHFSQLVVLPVRELVFYGLDDTEAPLHINNNNNNGGTNDDGSENKRKGGHVDPVTFHKLLSGTTDDDDGSSKPPRETVVIDVRNHYEAAIGRFDGQEQAIVATTSHGDSAAVRTSTADDGGHANATTRTAAREVTPNNNNNIAVATYVDPQLRKSTDFPAWVAQNAESLRHKRVLLYCTGGIRCERASAHLQHTFAKQELERIKTNQASKDHDNTDKTLAAAPPPPPTEVYQLQGGIEAYLAAFPDGGHWRGKNFTFDKREAIGVGDWNGDGGVVVGKKHKSGDHKAPTTSGTTVCVVCAAPWDRYVGKKKCITCGVPVLVCDLCLSDRRSGRCPLCVTQNVTVPVEDVEYTNNGKTTKAKLMSNNKYNAAAAGTAKSANTANAGKGGTNNIAAPTVLKWGGGHAAEKKERRRWKSTPCKFGTDCTRKDCFFVHPKR